MVDKEEEMPELGLQRAKSTVPCSTSNTETCVVPAKVTTIWTLLSECKFQVMAPEIVSACELVSGEQFQLGSVYSQTFTDGGKWTFRVTELSERNYTLGYEVMSTEPVHPSSSINGEISLRRVTDTDQTFVSWETSFSNDVDLQVMSD